MMELIAAQAAASAAELPFLLLQAAALVGMVSVLILLQRNIALDDARYKIYYGIIFGVTGFLLTLLVSEFIKLPSKPYIRSDLLFLAGVLGSWQGGLISLALVSAGRFLFGGPALFGAAFLDMSIISAFGMAMYGWMRRRSLTELGVREVFGVFAVRIFAALFAVCVTYSLSMINQDVFLSNVGRRIFGSLVGLPMIACLFLLLRSEARAREEARKRDAAARTDSLTGLPNRRALKDHIEVVMRQEPAVPHALLLIEIVNMADVAACQGEDWGDLFWPRLAQEICNDDNGLLSSSNAPRSFMFGDTTLAVVMSGISLEKSESTRLIMRLHDGLSTFSRSADPEPVPHLKIGAANLDKLSRQNVASFLRQLSLALRGSENPVQIFPFSFADKATRDEGVRQMLVNWIRSGKPPIFYQPKFEMHNRRMIGAEALLRAVDACGQPLSPYYVLEIAERHRLLVEFEWSTIEAVVRDLIDLRGLDPDFHLAVNISASSFATAGFGGRVVAFLNEMGVPAHRLSIEVTEMSRIPAIDIVQQNFDRLSEAGVRLALDDFGTGYAALTLLARFPFEEVKIDHWMTSRLEQSRFREAIALAFESAERYGATLVTEGIGTEEQSRLLMQMGIRFGQGYLYSPAVPLERLQPRRECA
ncbi:GGDEF domain-containing phosphodiesterase [Agrobacterium tumefaciens]|uniref:EAL domain-containing protein n=1 Tax=Agrobacterium TaxID=357 RepID=UPI000DD00607|nr:MULTISPECIES: GGDEF domain-containing phosphodiesterase [Agrobacterium]NSY42693.1 EAL domain-containing protein [Agrobacterium tumefaciens]NSZ83546.1 EAL domain-containing protein [Agrobacterium tumefaciens]WCA69757.1 GGDEF domain-containing phosphodiesterase [Agrobacterium tumefaciens]